jgi:hypothetical protein
MLELESYKLLTSRSRMKANPDEREHFSGEFHPLYGTNGTRVSGISIL